jgi:hypothetical protein
MKADARRLESKVGLEVLSNLSNESLEGKLSDEKLSRLEKRKKLQVRPTLRNKGSGRKCKRSGIPFGTFGSLGERPFRDGIGEARQG